MVLAAAFPPPPSPQKTSPHLLFPRRTPLLLEVPPPLARAWLPQVTPLLLPPSINHQDPQPRPLLLLLRAAMIVHVACYRLREPPYSRCCSRCCFRCCLHCWSHCSSRCCSRILTSLVLCTNQPCCRKAILVIEFEWAILGSRQVVRFAPAPARACTSTFAHADTTSPAGPAAVAAVPAADSDATAAAVAASAHSSVSVTRPFAPDTVLVAVFFITTAIIYARAARRHPQPRSTTPRSGSGSVSPRRLEAFCRLGPPSSSC